ncbi:unnamed protein product [Chrysoparadoxa australica]
MQYPQTIPESLVQFEQPIFSGLETSKGTGRGGEKDGKVSPNPTWSQCGGGGSSQLVDMVNSMLPPREWVEETGAWMQYVSKDPASRTDVINLQERLDKKLVERQARESGICLVREDLYGQSFDELIRQITLDGPERGLLCLRVRDEIRMTIDAYKTLYNSSVNFGIMKQLQAEQGMTELEEEILQLEEEKKALEHQVGELRNKVEVIEKRETEQRAVEEKKRKEDIGFLKYQGQHLDSFLKQIGGGRD